MSAPLALPAPMRRMRRSSLTLLALLAALTISLFSGTVTAHAEGSVPDKPEGLVYATEGAEVSAPDMDAITSLMDGLNGAHEEQVGIIITDEEDDAQGLADKALKDWGLTENGGLIVITTENQDVGVAVGSGLEENVPSDARGDVANKVKEGVGEYRDWAGGIRTGATRLFLYIEGQGLSGGTDGHHGDDGHSHEEGDPAVEEVPAGEAPDDAYVEGESTSEQGVSNTTKIVGGVVVILLASAGLFLLFRRSGSKKASNSDDAKDEESAPEE